MESVGVKAESGYAKNALQVDFLQHVQQASRRQVTPTIVLTVPDLRHVATDR
jgi:hypothetical protein